jgi:hypothetical protein
MTTPPWRERRERLRSPTYEAGVYAAQRAGCRAGENSEEPVSIALSPLSHRHSSGHPSVDQGIRGGGGSAARRLRLDGQVQTAMTPVGGNRRLQRLELAVDTIARVLGTAEDGEAPTRGQFESASTRSNNENALTPCGLDKAVKWKAKLAAAEAEAQAFKADAATAWEDAMQAYAERDHLMCMLAEARAEIIELRERLEASASGPSPEVRRAVALRRSARLLHGAMKTSS